MLSQSQQSSEISVGRHKHAIFVARQGKDCFIVGGLQSVIAYVRGVVTVPSQSVGDLRRQCIVD